ncbi:response regulator transcription factor [Chloroflexota bacterium]
MVKTRVLIVDDEPSIIRYLKRNIEASGFKVLVAMDGADGLQLFERELPDLVVLDIKMPDMDGFEVCRRIREWSQIPVIMLTALGSLEEKVKAFDIGADDYITKPFGKAELMARVKAVLRRTTLWDERPEPELRAHNLLIDFAKHRVTSGEQEVNLTDTQYRLLSYMARNAGRVITPDQILEKVWGEGYVGEYHFLRVNISRLRQKLGDDSREPRFITTKSGIGYMFRDPS